ncbi:hypothetical protein POX_c04207 [Penicillium oxalicum]|uniref:hypothetical protein n=1 Tax=Penicillium oxalicum TaxID=69781 RepID=UPI0020B83A4F|nr:hypothetical protein POX_c04207 [Penicillium oxalicum]KAI2791350.1 hypothetical protein POX_c04207 [Penicillium oxalicum]
MGQKTFFAQQDEASKQLAKNGYVFGAYAKEDAIRQKDKRIPKTKKMYSSVVRRWMEFFEQNGIKGYEFGPGCATPDYVLLKEFFRWYGHTARGKKKRLFGGFEEELQIKIVMEDRSEIYNWIRRTLTGNEGWIENVEDPDHSFTKKDFLRVISSIWKSDHRRFIPGLLKAIITLALQLYLFTGARIGAFIPAHEDRDKRGLRYKDIELVLFPSPTAPWKVEWKVNQVWLKNNRNPDYTVFGIGIRDTKKPQFASGYVLLAIALQHGALFGINTAEDLAKYDLSDGRPIPLRWKDEYLNKPVLRNVTADGPQDVPLTKERFCEILRGRVTAAGYSESLTIHKVRKFLGSVIEGKHGSALVSQIYGHKDAGTYPKDYVLHCSSIDTVSAVLGEEDQSSHIEYFQGCEKFYERGLPGELPAEVEEKILLKPEMVEIRSRIKELEALGDKISINAERLKYRKTLVRFRLSELKKYQSSWIRERRDQRILNKGKDERALDDDDVCTRVQALIMPDFARISTLMNFDGELSFDEMLLFVEDLKNHCERDFDVIYLPQESPVKGRCPARDCNEEITRLKKTDRSTHIHNCVRREIALNHQVLESELKFCYECMKWFQLSHWRDHCSFHIQSWVTRQCEVIVYRHTVIRPGYCPFCVWNNDLAAEDRLHYWLTSGNLRQHIEEQHMNGNQSHGEKSICGCGESFDEERGLRHHLHDIHKLNKAIWLSPKRQRKRRNTCKAESRKSSEEPEERCSKRVRFYRYPPPRHEHEYQLSNTIFIPVPTLHAFVEEHPEQYYCSSLSSKATQSSGSSSGSLCSSATISPLSSRPTTPGLDVIDPRILTPLDFYQARRPQLYGQDYSETDVLEIPPDGQDIKCQTLSVGAHTGAPIRITADQSTTGLETIGSCSLEPAEKNTNDGYKDRGGVTNQLQLSSQSSIETNAIEKATGVNSMDLHILGVSTTGFTASEANEEKKHSRDAQPDSKSANSICSDAEIESESHYPAHQGLIDRVTSLGTDSITNLKKPLTRAQARRQQPMQQSSNHSTEKTLRQKLNATEKRKLRELKSKNWTLRQIGPHFADIDMTWLRQAWMDIKPPQRCTRSRATQIA